MKATRAGLVWGLGVLFLVASLLVPAASAGSTPGKILLRGPVDIGGDTWTQEILATDGSTDSVTISLSQRLPETPAYNLKETHSYSFPGLDPDTVVINDNLTGSIDVDPSQTGLLFAMSADLVKIAGVKPSTHCGGDLRRRLVDVAGGATLSLDTLNTALGLVEGLPDSGQFKVESGECGTCRKLSRALVGVNSRELLGGIEESLSWEKRHNFLQNNTTIDVSLERELVPLLTTVGETVVSVSGTLADEKVGKNATTFNADGLPLLSGEAVLTNLDGLEKGPWVSCSELEIYREEVRSGDQTGDLTFDPTGLPVTGIDTNLIPWTSSDAMREYVNWAEIAPPF